MNWFKALLIVGVVLALVGGTSFAGLEYGYDGGTSGGGVSWYLDGNWYSVNVFANDYNNNVINQVKVAWGNLPANTAAQVLLIAMPTNSTNFNSNDSILQDVSTTVTSAQTNGAGLTYDGTASDFWRDSSNNPATITNPTWTTYNITPTTISTPYFAVATLVNDSWATVATTLLDWGQGGSNTGGTNVSGASISWVGYQGANNNAYSLLYGGVGANGGNITGWSPPYYNNPFLIRAEDTTGASAAVTFTWNYDRNNGTFNWNNSGGQDNWHTGAGGAFPDRIDDTVVIQTVNATIDLGGNTYTIGTFNAINPWWGDKTFTDLRNGTLNFQVSSGSATLTDSRNSSAGNPDVISANIQLSSPLVIALPTYGYSGTAPQLYNMLKITGQVFGNNGITKTGPGTLSLTNATNSFTGDIRIQDGNLYVANWAALPAGNTIYLGSQGGIGYLFFNDSSDRSDITRPFVLAGEGGGFYVNTWTGNGWPASAGDWTSAATPTACTLNGVISGTGNLFIGQGYATTFKGTSDNTYVGDTKVTGWANVLSTARVLNGNIAISAGARVDLASANNVDPTKSVYVGSFKMASPQCNTLGVLALGGDFVPTLDPNSSGLLSLVANMPGAMYEQGLTGPGINAALAVGAPQLGNGYMWIGSVGPQGNPPMSETFTGTSLQPNIDHVFRLFSGLTLGRNNDWQASGQGVLTDVGGVSCSVEIAAPQTGGMGGVGTNDINDFTGSLTVDAAAMFSGWAQSGGSPFGAATGDVNLNGGALYLASYNGAPAMAAKNNLNLQGQTALIFWTGDSNCKTAMTFNNIVRNNNAILAISPNWGGTGGVLGTNVSVFATNPPANTNGMVPAWIVRYAGEGFLKYDATAGFVDAAFTATDGFGANNGTDIVNLTGNTTVAAGSKAWAVRANGAMTGGDITIGSGGLILAGSGVQNSYLVSSSNLNFGSAEGIIYQSGHGSGDNWWAAGWNELAGTITGTNGLTFGAPYYGNGASLIYISGDNSATLSGPITIDMTIVKINNSGSLGTGTITLNGGTGSNGNCICGALSPHPTPILDGTDNYGAIIPLDNNIVIGPNGGAFMMDYWDGKFALYGQVTGPGTMSVRGHVGNPVYLYNANNNWTGGTIVGGQLIVEPGSKIGPGNVLITDYWGTLNLLGTGNTDSTNNIDLFNTWPYSDSTVLNVHAASATIGTLEGNGRVYLNASNLQGNTVLTLGNSGSTSFYGVIQDYGVGSIAKQGTGTITLWGESIYRGSTTVNAGTLAVNGKIAGNGVSVNGGTLTGTGNIGTSVTVNDGGTLAGSLHITSGVQVYGGTVNTSGATIDGGLYMDVGSVGIGNFGGSSTVNGDSETDGGTISGSHTFNGSLTLDSYDGTASLSGTNTINGSLSVGYYGDAASVSGNTTINSPSGTVGLYLGSISGTNNYTVNTVYLNPWSYGPCTFGGTGTINANGFVEYANTVVSGTYTFNTPVQVNGGTFQGNHTINGSFTTAAGSHAVVAPHNGAGVGTLTIVGNVSLDHSTTLNFNLASPGTSGSGINDIIDITGNLSLDGTLNVNALSGFGAGTYRLFNYTGALSGTGLTQGTMPTGLGFTYTIDTSAANQVNLDVVTPFIFGDTDHSGGSTLNSLDIDAIYHHFGQAYTTQWKVAQDTNPVGQEDVTYELTQLMHTNYGDANLDRFTDFTDFQVLLDHWQAPGGWAQGDFNGDGVVDFLDFQVLLDYWNPGGWNAGTSQVPEPATLSLLALGGLALLRRSRK